MWQVQKDMEMTSWGHAAKFDLCRSVVCICLRKSQPLSESNQLQVETDHLCWGASGASLISVYLVGNPRNTGVGPLARSDG